MPSVPELSFISDSFSEPSDFKNINETQQPPHQANQQQNRHTNVRPRLEAQSDPHGSFSPLHSKRQRLPGTSNSPPQGPEAQVGLKVGMGKQSHRQNRPGPLRTLNGQETHPSRGMNSSYNPNGQYISPQGQKTTPGKGSSSTSFRSSRTLSDSGIKRAPMKTEKKPAQAVTGLASPGSVHSANRKSQHHIHSPSGNHTPQQQMHQQEHHQQQPETRNWDQANTNSHNSTTVENNNTPQAMTPEQYTSHSEPPSPHPSSHRSGGPSIPTGQSHSPASGQAMGQRVKGHPEPHPPNCNSEIGHMSSPQMDQFHRSINQDPKTNSYSSIPQNAATHPLDNTESSQGYTGSPHSAGPPLHNPPPIPATNGNTVHTDSIQTPSIAHRTTSLNDTQEHNYPSSGSVGPTAQGSELDSRTLEQLKRQEEMIQQLQEQV